MRSKLISFIVVAVICVIVITLYLTALKHDQEMYTNQGYEAGLLGLQPPTFNNSQNQRWWMDGYIKAERERQNKGVK